MTKKFVIAARGFAIVIIGAVALTGTKGGLAHFSPYTFEYTTQSEFTLFFGLLTIYRSTPRQVDNPVVTMLKDEHFVAPAQSQDMRRELIFHWNEAWRDGDGPLYDVFVRHRHEVIQWSMADRQRARLCWLTGFEFLRSRREVDVWIGREILIRGWRCKSSSELEERIMTIKETRRPWE